MSLLEATQQHLQTIFSTCFFFFQYRQTQLNRKNRNVDRGSSRHRDCSTFIEQQSENWRISCLPMHCYCKRTHTSCCCCLFFCRNCCSKCVGYAINPQWLLPWLPQVLPHHVRTVGLRMTTLKGYFGEFNPWSNTP